MSEAPKTEAPKSAEKPRLTSETDLTKYKVSVPPIGVISRVILIVVYKSTDRRRHRERCHETGHRTLCRRRKNP